MHRWMVPIAAVATIALVAVAPSTSAAAVGAVFGVGSVSLFFISAVAHYKIWDPVTLGKLFRLDQSMIMIFIAASTLPVGYQIGGRAGLWLSVGMAFGALIGIALIWAPFHPPRGFTNALFLAVAWWPILFIGPISSGLSAVSLWLLFGGAGVYTTGSLVVGSQRPNPNPEVFGYHEIWHIFVIVGNALHFALVALIVTGNA